MTSEALNRIVGLIKTSYTHLVIDLSKSYNELDYEALSMADDILLITQLDLPCLRNTVRLLASMESTSGLRDKVKVIVNRVGLNNGQISIKKAQESIRDDIFWQIPNDYTTMVEVRNNGVPLQVQAPKAAITSAFRSLNRALFESDEIEESGDKSKKASGGLFGMFKGKAKS